MKNITIIGGGPAALILAAQLDLTQYNITIYDKKKTVGRKFLVAGEGGLNLTYSASLDKLISQYVPSEFMSKSLTSFTNEDLIQWLLALDIPTFVGSSNRVFPTKGTKPITVLNKLLAHVATKNVRFTLGTQWEGWNDQGGLCFDNHPDTTPDIVVFAMGGASWKITGSDGTWRSIFEKRGIAVHPFKAANCAFAVAWDTDFIKAHEGNPLKNIALSYGTDRVKGELVISSFGLEGNAIYALSQKIQDSLLTESSVIIYIDLKPSLTIAQITAKYKEAHYSKPTDILKKDINLDRTAISLIKKYTDRKTFTTPDLLIATIKALPITITAAGPLDEAISSIGGIALDEVDENFKLKKITNTYAIGEMLDWYAPTGGYLLQGCFSMGYALATHLNSLENTDKT